METKQRGCQILNGDRILIGRIRRIKMFWKKVRKGGSRTEEMVKDVNGRLKGSKTRKRWAEYFELLDVQEDIVAVGGCSGGSNGGRE